MWERRLRCLEYYEVVLGAPVHPVGSEANNPMYHQSYPYTYLRRAEFAAEEHREGREIARQPNSGTNRQLEP
jgi:hypothetical protein